MLASAGKYQLRLLGSFGLFAPDGHRIPVSSKKGMALIALLATARDGVRSRGWLQDVLWGSRASDQASASLRRELSNLRPLLNRDSEMLGADHYRVWLDLDRVALDIHAADEDGDEGGAGRLPAQFLEGIDIAGEEAFEDWLRDERTAIEERRGRGTGHGGPGETGTEGLPSVIAALQGRAGPFLDRPLVAVLPFANLTGSRDNDYLAVGIAEELIEYVARLRWLPVVARAASFGFSSESWSTEEVLARTRARYVVEGRVRGQGDRFGIAVSAVETATRRLIWTKRADVAVEAIPEHLPVLIHEMVGALAMHIDDAEMNRAIARRDRDPTVTDLIFRARWHRNRYTREDSAEAGRLLEAALERDPFGAEAIIQLADFRQQQIWVSRGGPEQVRDLRRLAQRAIAADHLDGRGFMVAGIAEIWMRHTRPAIALLEHAIELNPSLAYAYSQLGAAHYLSGDPGTALEMLGRALRLNMSEWHLYYALGEVAMARAMLGELDEAVEAADQAIIRRAGYWYAHVAKVHALVLKGDLGQAGEARRELQRAKPSFDASFIDWVPFIDAGWPAALKASLETAAAQTESIEGNG